MFNTDQFFTKQFTAAEGGYLYYPSRRSGGKLVTEDEYRQLLSDYIRVAGSRGKWKLIGLVILTIIAWQAIAITLELPEWSDTVVAIGLGFMVIARFAWVSFAPRRLVKGRPDAAPPRSGAELRRTVRAMIPWPMVVLVLIVSGGIFLLVLGSAQGTTEWWVWLTGSGALFATYSYVAVNKFRDGRR